MKYNVCIETSPHWHNNYTAETRVGAVRLAAIAKSAGKKAEILWLPESTKDIREATKAGRFWARKVWHFGNVPESKAKHAAIRAWAKVAKIRED